MDQKTIETYNRTADDYEQDTSDFWAKTPQPPFIDDFIAALAGPTVLDVGSGPGRDSLIFRERGLEPVCLDASAAMLALTAKKGLPSVHADFAHLPFGAATFDGVWAYTSLLHVPKTDIDRPLAEIRRVLKTAGCFGLGLIEGQSEEYRDTRDTGNPRLFSYYTVEEVHAALTRNGFSLAKSSAIKPGTRTYLHFLARTI